MVKKPRIVLKFLSGGRGIWMKTSRILEQFVANPTLTEMKDISNNGYGITQEYNSVNRYKLWDSTRDKKEFRNQYLRVGRYLMILLVVRNYTPLKNCPKQIPYEESIWRKFFNCLGKPFARNRSYSSFKGNS